MIKTSLIALIARHYPDLSGLSIPNIDISELVLDSRVLKRGDTFVAVNGHSVDGRRFIPNAVDAEVNLILAESSCNQGSLEWIGTTPVLYLPLLAEKLSEISLFCYPVEQPLVAVTGTNGKTTVTQLIAQWTNLLGQKAAVLGTAGNGFLDDLQQAANTTGSAIDIAKQLHSLEQCGATLTALEVSSHGLIQNRVKGLPFSVSLFTNLTRDHLDYHGTMAEYEAAKKLLFTTHQTHRAVINVDDPVGKRWHQELTNAVGVSLVTNHSSTENMVFATGVIYSEQGFALNYDGVYGSGELAVPLIGEFNANNVLLAFTALLSLGYEKQLLTEAAQQLRPVIGRMELFQNADKPKVVVDYAHTPDALEKALRALRVHCSGKLWAIFGCGGDRDTGKRPMMADIGETLADVVVLTDDNPRSEAPEQIVKDMLQGMKNPELAVVKHDRQQALEYAVAQAGPEDIILLAGKGHEDYQVFADRTVHYSDRETAQALLEASL